jgi:hypothetical protein
MTLKIIGVCSQVARTDFRNLLTSALSWLLSPVNNCAAESTSDESELDPLAPHCTSAV